MRIIKKIAFAFFKNKKILLVRSMDEESVFYTLGGKSKNGEDDIPCLKREVFEEIGCRIDESSIKFLKEFEDIAHRRKDTLLNIRLYEGKLIGEPKKRSEIAEIGFFDSNSPKENLSEIAQRKIFPWLQIQGFIN